MTNSVFDEKTSIFDSTIKPRDMGGSDAMYWPDPKVIGVKTYIDDNPTPEVISPGDTVALVPKNILAAIPPTIGEYYQYPGALEDYEASVIVAIKLTARWRAFKAWCSKLTRWPTTKWTQAKTWLANKKQAWIDRKNVPQQKDPLLDRLLANYSSQDIDDAVAAKIDAALAKNSFQKRDSAEERAWLEELDAALNKWQYRGLMCFTLRYDVNTEALDTWPTYLGTYGFAIRGAKSMLAQLPNALIEELPRYDSENKVKSYRELTLILNALYATLDIYAILDYSEEQTQQRDKLYQQFVNQEYSLGSLSLDDIKYYPLGTFFKEALEETEKMPSFPDYYSASLRKILISGNRRNISRYLHQKQYLYRKEVNKIFEELLS